MARTGVLYSEVAEAAAQLVGQGRNPTVEQVRLLLGTGSSTTIANHLRQWKANQESTSLLSAKESIPPELVALMKGLWEKVLNNSQEKITHIELHYQQTIAELNEELEKYKNNNKRWQKFFNQWQQEKTQLANEKLTLEQALDFSYKEKQTLQTKQDVLLQQLQDKQEHIEELQRLHKQAQQNLEHYRESAREQRLLDQQQFDREKNQLHAENKNLAEQLSMHREKISAFNQQFHALNQSYETLEKTHQSKQIILEQTIAKLETSENSKNEQLHAKELWQAQCRQAQNDLVETSKRVIETQAELKLLLQQLADANQKILSLEDQNKLLAHEKWKLAQEKAHLEGQLKQIQKTVIAD